MVTAFSVDEYATAMTEMYGSADLTALGAAGRDLARRNDWDLIATQQEDAYYALLAAAR